MKKYSLLFKGRYLLLAVLLAGFANTVMAQGAAGLDQASTELATYIDPIGNLILVLGAIIGLIGAARVFAAWNSGDSNASKGLMNWFGACIFLIMAGILVKAFFGIA